MADLDLTVLGAPAHAGGVALARCGRDLAMEELPWDEMPALALGRARLDGAIRGEGRPRAAELRRFGHALYRFLVRDRVRDLYAAHRARTGGALLRVQLASNRADVRALPWELLQEPGDDWGPRLQRSIVRVVPTVGTRMPDPRPLSGAIRVLMAYADPVDEQPVPWPDLKAMLEREFASEPGGLELTVIEGTPAAWLTALQRERFDVVHFVGHGFVKDGIGHLVFADGRGGGVPRSGSQVARLLADRDVRLVVLTSCDSASGDFRTPFSQVAESLAAYGLPAVVACQFPLPVETAGPFVRSLYRELLASGDVDRAVNEGRLALATALAAPRGPDDGFEWGIPTLHRHLGAAQVFAP